MLLSVEETFLKGSELPARIKLTGVVQIRQRSVHAGHRACYDLTSPAA